MSVLPEHGPAAGRLPIESSKPIVVFAWTRLGLALLSLGVVVALGFPYSGRLAIVVAGVALPWSLANLVLARRSPSVAMSPLVAIGDMLMLLAIEAMAPETYAAVRFMALALLAVHAHFQGARIGLVIAAVSVPALLLPAALSERGVVHGRLLAFYEVVFAAAAVASVWLVGGFRSAESASRLRARELTRRMMRAESDVRRRVSEALHDGPVQELIGLDMVLAAARREAEREGAENTARLLGDARDLAERNVRSLREEMIDLGPHAYEELSYEAALERCRPVWQRRYGLETSLEVDAPGLPSEMEGDLFRITQEAVVNAAKHGKASRVRIRLVGSEDTVELSVEDDGRGFGTVDPLQGREPGHIGLAAMRERAELLRGTLRIESSQAGSTVTVSAPRPSGSRGAPRSREQAPPAPRSR